MIVYIYKKLKECFFLMNCLHVFTKEGNPPMVMKVMNEDTNARSEPLS